MAGSSGRHAIDVTSIAGLAATINSDLDLHSVLQAVTDTATRAAGAEFGAFFYNTVDASGNTFRLHVLSGAHVEAFAHMPAPRITELFRPTYDGERAVRIADLHAHPGFTRLPRGHLPLRSYLAAPVVARDGEVIGSLLFGHPEPDVFDADDQAMVEALAAHAAVAIGNARAFAAQVEATRAAEQAAAEMASLQRVTARLARATSSEDAVVALHELLVAPAGADQVAAYLPRDGVLRGLVTDARPREGDDPQLPVVPRVHATTWPLDEPSLVEEARRTDRPVWVGSREELERRFPAIAEAFPALVAAAAFPLTSEGTRGAMAVSWTRQPDFCPVQQSTFAAAADQLASTLERLRLQRAEARARDELARRARDAMATSATLQRSLLPSVVPQLPGLSVAVRYAPAATGAEVGGDWYDVVVGPHGRVTLVVGDVEGHSIAAAAVMGRISMGLHAYLAEGHSLDVALARTNRLVEDQGVLVTCFLLEVDPQTGEVEMARAGHPLPVHSRDGRTAELDLEGGPPLGIPGGSWPVTRGRARRGDRLVVYTDGLVERRGSDAGPRSDEERVAELCRIVAASDRSVEGLADELLVRIGPGSDDDVALLVAEFGASVVPVVARLRLETPRDIAAARRFAVAHLERWGLDGLGEDVSLVVSELVTNALVHGGGHATLELRPDGGDAVTVTVVDDQPQEPRHRSGTQLAEAGRGLGVVGDLAVDWGVAPDGAGKRVWARLRPPRAAESPEIR